MAAIGEGPVKQVLVHGPLELDLERWRVRVYQREVKMSASQFRLLKLLMTKPGRVWTRDQIIDAIWDPRACDEKRPQVVDVMVSRIRDRLGEGAHLIETVRSVGYRLGG